MGEFLAGNDRQILRDLGKRIAELGNLPVMERRRQCWCALNGLRESRPMMLVETFGVIRELEPLLELRCQAPWARSVETDLKLKVYHYESIPDDMVVEPWITWGERVQTDFFGLQLQEHVGQTDGHEGSRSWDAPIADLDGALERLRPRQWSLDPVAGRQQCDRLQEVFQGILPVVRRGWYWWSTGMTETLMKLIGLERMMLAMIDQPDQLHALMAFLRDDMQNMLDWHQAKGLLEPNIRDDYIGSGGRGYTDCLPGPGYGGGPATLADMWGLSESQETVGVSAGMFAEFIFPYQLPIISRFGLACYGCCEPLEKRWETIRRIRNLRRISVSPWADQRRMADLLGKNYVFNRKPSPMLVSTGRWDEEEIRRDIRNTLDVTRGMHVDLILKDVHTVNGQPRRLGRWAQIAREEIERAL